MNPIIYFIYKSCFSLIKSYESVVLLRICIVDSFNKENCINKKKGIGIEVFVFFITVLNLSMLFLISYTPYESQCF